MVACMKRRVVGFVLLGGLLAGCSVGAEQCGKNAGPETVILDATAYVEEGSWIEACLLADEPDGEYCNEPGSEPVVSVNFGGEYPTELQYSVTRVVDGSSYVGLERGTHQMRCAEVTVRLDVGPDPAGS